ncbi:MAG: family 43 glycosylhydrolase [Clostridia bacterium]|nr:family 43 glycosylhydrolase [Clostridia bacterium]
MNSENARRTPWNTPLIERRADPHVSREGGAWYFTATVPEYDRIILRRAATLDGLAAAEEKTVWHAHESGVMASHIWAPELHRIDGKWYIYFAAGEKEDVWKIRPWVLECEGDDPVADPWTERGMLTRAEEDEYSFTDFSLDMTVFEHGGKHYCVWAEKVSAGKKISNLYIAEMKNALELATPQMLLSSPDYAWERHGFWVNEGASFTEAEGRMYISFSASDTGRAYCIGLLWADADADPMDFSAWHKVNRPVMVTDEEKGLYGPGHNTFFRDENGKLMTSFHARTYDEIEGDPLDDGNRNTYVAAVETVDGGMRFQVSGVRCEV